MPKKKSPPFAFNAHHKLTREREYRKQKALDLHRSGKTLQQIAREIGASERTVVSYLRELKVVTVRSRLATTSIIKPPNHHGNATDWLKEAEYAEKLFPNSPAKQDLYLINKWVPAYE